MEKDAFMLAMDSGGQHGIRLHLFGILRFLYNLKVEWRMQSCSLRRNKMYSIGNSAAVENVGPCQKPSHPGEKLNPRKADGLHDIKH